MNVLNIPCTRTCLNYNNLQTTMLNRWRRNQLFSWVCFSERLSFNCNNNNKKNNMEMCVLSFKSCLENTCIDKTMCNTHRTSRCVSLSSNVSFMLSQRKKVKIARGGGWGLLSRVIPGAVSIHLFSESWKGEAFPILLHYFHF